MKMMKRILCVTLVFVMALGMLPWIEKSAEAAVSLYWPVPGHTTLSRGYHDNRAIDIWDGNITGATVIAALGGKVDRVFYCTSTHYKDTSCSECYGYGTAVSIKGADGRIYMYAHLQAGSIPSNVYSGASVSACQVLGMVGNTGNSSGAHLHFAISVNTIFDQSGKINPENETYIYSTSPSEGDATVNLGDSFTAPIFNKDHWKIIENNNGTVQTADEIGVAKQLWKFERQSDGSYIISSCVDGLCLDVADASNVSGTKVCAWEKHGGDNQRWYIYEEAGGYVLKAKCTDCVLDLPNNDPTNGNQLQMYTKNGTGAQVWAIYRGDECKLTAPTLSVSVGKSSTKTTFTWNNVYGETGYHVKIWKGTIWKGDAYHIQWNTSSGWGIQLPEGTYQAYVDVYNHYETIMSNVVTFTVQAGTYTISYNANGGTGAPSSQTKTHGSDLTLTSSTPTGAAYTVRFDGNGGTVSASSIKVYKPFLSWNTKSDGTGTSYAPGGSYSQNVSTTLYAQWDNATLGGTTAPTRSGYYFAGWYDSTATDSLGYPTGMRYTASTTVGRSITLYAMWLPTSYMQFGDLNCDGDISSVDALIANKYRLNSYTPEYDLNEFLLRGDLNRDGEIDIKDVSLIQDLSLNKKAQADFAKSINKTSVSNVPQYNYKNGEKLNTEGLGLSILFDTGTTYTIKDGLTISGYDPYNSGTQTVTVKYYQFSATYSVKVDAKTYTVSYNTNGGTGAPSNQIKTHGVNLILSNTKPTRSGYTFLGWSTSSTATSATYQPGGSFTANANTTLYAVWRLGCENGNHSYSYKSTKAPTTSATGTLTGTCSKCSGTVTVTLPKLNTTDYTYSVTKAATCTAAGNGRYTWKTTTYGTFSYDVSIAAKGHSYTKKVTAPTCTAQGYTTYTCSCGYSYKDNYTNATGHSYSYKSTKAPTTSATGTLTGTCSKCSGTTTVTLPKLNTTDYAYSVTKAATCTAAGNGRYTWKTTTYGTFSYDVSIAAKGHSYTKKVTAATCTAQGYTTYTCSCGHSYKDNYTNATGHSYSYKSTKAPTTSATGTLTGTCAKCSGTTTVTLPKLNTTEYSYAVVNQPSSSATGTGRYTWNTTTYGAFSFDVTLDKIGLLGDINGDGKVNMKDWNRVYEHLSEVSQLTGDALRCADVNGDGKVNMKDWNRLYEHLSETNPLW